MLSVALRDLGKIASLSPRGSTAVSDLLTELERYGSTPEHSLDLSVPSPRGLRFADLVQASPDGSAPVVVESNGRALIYVVDGRAGLAPSAVSQWVRRVAFRGDAEWLGVLRPGRLDIHPAVLGDSRKLERVDDLPALGLRLPALVHKPGSEGVSVRTRLRNLLFSSMKRAKQEFSLSAQDSLSLVGRALFWRFLVDRGLLDRLVPSSVVQGPKSWAECFDRKRWALDTFAWLEATFNGGLLEFETRPDRISADAFSSIAGGIAHKADASGQLSLPASWAEVDFAHVPVGLLSEVYEAFVHDADRDQASDESLFYTPRYLAEYVVDEALDALDDVARPRILDPAAGAGVFLVAAFRALVAREWERTGSRPSRGVVRRVLNQQIVGFDIDGNALRLAELALYLTAIELDPDRNPQPLDLLRFTDSLLGKVLVEKPGGKLVGSLGPVVKKHRFDAVIGNPPWTALKSPKNPTGGQDLQNTKAVKKAWVDASRAIVAQRLGEARAMCFGFPDANPDLPFVYRAMEWAKVGGVIALITHARWLFGQSRPAIQAREDLLACVHVTGILNGAALRQTKVWPNVDAAFCILFATNETPPEGAAFHFVSPELDTDDSSQDRLRIDWHEAQAVEVEDVVKYPWSLKARFRGTMVDEGVLRGVGRRGIPLADYLASLGTEINNGYQVSGVMDSHDMWHLHDLRGSDLSFFIDTERLELFRRPALHRKRKLKNYLAPLLIVHESMVVDSRRPRSGLATSDLAYDERFDGISFAGIPSGVDIAAYLQLVLQSSLTTHGLLMLDGQFGVEREVVHLQTLRQVPVVPWHALGRAEKQKAARLAARLRGGLDAALQEKIDTFVDQLHGLSEVQRDAVSDTLSTSLPTKDARVRALSPTTSMERQEFVDVCQLGLQDILAASGLTAWVRNRDDLSAPTIPWCFIQVDVVQAGKGALDLAQLPIEQFVRVADAGAASLVVLRLGKGTSFVGMLDRYRHWTKTRARLLVSVLLAEGEL